MARNMQLRIMEFISDYAKDCGYAPSYREIAHAVGLKSPSSVHRHIEQLKARGEIEAEPGRARTISAQRGLCIDTACELPQRIRLDLADGGNICFDLSIENHGSRQLNLHFSGILDASCLKSNVSRIIRCETEF